jgi:hypothetical protein
VFCTAYEKEMEFWSRLTMRMTILFLLSGFIALPLCAQSVADAARNNRPNDAQVTTQRVWTDDDFPSSGKQDSPAPTEKQETSASETLQQFRLLGKEDLGAAVLKVAHAPDVVFPERKDWEQRLLDAKQAWVSQVDRMEGHKDSSKESQDTEIRLAQGAQQNFERIEEEGIEQARAVDDPKLKAHLDYQRQLEFCKQTTGDMLQKCLASLDQLKWQMEREGTW